MKSIFFTFAMTFLLSFCSLLTHAGPVDPNTLGIIQIGGEIPKTKLEMPINKPINPGTLEVTQLGGEIPKTKLEMPLKHTDVNIEISGFVASATVTQHYHNPFNKPIEAVYTFPLPNDAAVDSMQMTIGSRTINGLIKRRKEARQIYDQARAKGQRASLLEQERPNIFTQSVANIMPGDNVIITIRYVNILPYAEGSYELVFPMVVGPRYTPSNVDASRITPPVLKPGERSGHDIALAVKLDAGVAIKNVQSSSHIIDTKKINQHEQEIKLHSADRLPNKDFVLRYEVAGQVPEIATIAHHDKRGGFFTLIIQPQRSVTDDQVIPRELIFIVDTSGSMYGFPIEKSKEAMRRLIKGMRSTDLFNVVRFAGDTGTLWSQPKPKTSANVNEALRYIKGFRGYGGTEMRTGIINALEQPATAGYLRIAFLLTDGYVGNEFGIFQAIEKERRGARVFSLGVGSSVNRYLLDRAAEIGRGEAFYVRQDENSDKVIEKFFQRVDRPALAHIEIDWGKLDVTELYPAKVPDLWAGQPIRIHGRYTKGGVETIKIRGQLANRAYEQQLRVELPQNAADHEAMASVWARQKVRKLKNQMVRQGQTTELVKQVTELGLNYKLMTQWTSFVAVEEKIVNVDGKPQTVVQPVELPEGVSYQGVFGKQPVPTSRNMRFRGKAGSGYSTVQTQRSKGRTIITGARVNRINVIGNGGKVIVRGKIINSGNVTAYSNTRGSGNKVATSAVGIRVTPNNNAAIQAIANAGKKVKVKAPSNEITFAPGKATLTAQVKRILDKLATQICQDFAQIKSIVITGHADNSPTDNYKQKLSLQRAVAVAEYLKRQCPKLTDDKLVIRGEADRKPIADNGTEAGQARNRRVEVLIKK